MSTKKLYQELALKLNAISNCIDSDNQVWLSNHIEDIKNLNQFLPSGSGFDSGSMVNLELSQDNKIVIDSSYHLMDQFGFYSHWVDFTITVTSCLMSGFNLDIKYHCINQDDPGCGDDFIDDPDHLTDFVLDIFWDNLNQDIRKDNNNDYQN